MGLNHMVWTYSFSSPGFRLCCSLGIIHTAWKVSKYGLISGLYFPVLGMNTEIYEVNLRIQSEYRKIRTRNNFIFERFSRTIRNNRKIICQVFHWCTLLFILIWKSVNQRIATLDLNVWVKNKHCGHQKNSEDWILH